MPLVHQTLSGVALADKRTQFDRLDRSATPFEFHISGSAEYFLWLSFGFGQATESQWSNRALPGKRWQFRHSNHEEFYPKQTPTHRALLNVHQRYTAVLRKPVQSVEAS